MYSIEPTSRPRVGCEAISSLIGRENSRATMTFCWLPPDNALTVVVTLGVRMSNFSTRFWLFFDNLVMLGNYPMGKRRLVIGVQYQVIRNWEGEYQAVFLTILRNVGGAQLRNLAGGSIGGFLPQNGYFSVDRF